MLHFQCSTCDFGRLFSAQPGHQAIQNPNYTLLARSLCVPTPMLARYFGTQDTRFATWAQKHFSYSLSALASSGSAVSAAQSE